MSLEGINFIKEITSFIFVEDKPEYCDIIFIPGSAWPEPAEKASKLWLEGYAPYILPSENIACQKDIFQDQ